MTTKAEWKARAKAAEAHAARLSMLIDEDVTFRDLEMKMRDGSFDLRAVLGDGSRPATKFLAAMMMHAVLGDDDGEEPWEPENYRSTNFEWAVTPSGSFETLRCSVEIIKPGGKSSHEIRRDLEAELHRLRDGAS